MHEGMCGFVAFRLPFPIWRSLCVAHAKIVIVVEVKIDLHAVVSGCCHVACAELQLVIFVFKPCDDIYVRFPVFRSRDQLFPHRLNATPQRS